MKNRIICPVIKAGGIFYSNQGSKSHDACIQHAIEEGADIRDCERGFFDSNGEFHNRKEAFKIAKKAGQLSLTNEGPVLYSYDIKEWGR